MEQTVQVTNSYLENITKDIISKEQNVEELQEQIANITRINENLTEDYKQMEQQYQNERNDMILKIKEDRAQLNHTINELQRQL